MHFSQKVVRATLIRLLSQKLIRRNVMCVSFEKKWNGLLQSRSKDSILKIVLLAFIIHHNIAHKLLLRQAKCFLKF